MGNVKEEEKEEEEEGTKKKKMSESTRVFGGCLCQPLFEACDGVDGRRREPLVDIVCLRQRDVATVLQTSSTTERRKKKKQKSLIV